MNNAIQRTLSEMKKEIQCRQESQAAASALDVTQHIADIYKPLHDDIKENRHQIYNLPGGRGSGKSSFCALEIVSGVMQDQSGRSNAIIFRRTANTMRESVFSQISWAIDKLDVNDLWRGSVSPMSWTYRPTGAQIVFRGLDDTTKLKSIKPRQGYFRYIWFEEFSELPGENFVRSIMQSVQRGGNVFTVFRSFNPPISAANWANCLVQRPDDRSLTLHTSYLDIPQEWLGLDFIAEAERLKAINERAYRHEYLGESTGSGGEVFPNITVREITDAEISQMQYIYAGIDFGFSVDPAVYVRVSFDRKTDTVFLIDEIYRKHCSNSELAAAIKEKKGDITAKIVDDVYVPYMGKQTIICDCSEPKSIADLCSLGLHCIPCQKFPGSAIYGIKWLQNRRIIIDPKRTPNAHREFVGYEYECTKDGEFLADVPDRDNHTVDSVRYALDRVINRRGVSA